MKFDEIYNELLNEIKYYGQDRQDQNNDRNAGLENDWKHYERSPRPAQKEGDVFTGKDGRKWVRYKKADGTLGVRPHKG
jgi:hypothetical protein